MRKKSIYKLEKKLQETTNQLKRKPRDSKDLFKLMRRFEIFEKEIQIQKSYQEIGQ